VVIAEINDTGVQVESLINSEGGSALFVKTDISSESSVKELSDKSIKAFGKVDIVINNAIVTSFGSVLEQPLSAWDRVFAVNFRGSLIMIKAFLPGMLERKDGAVANVLSNEGLPYLAPYSASKEALRSLTSSLVAELGEGSGVSVFNLAPGMVDTPGGREGFNAVAPRLGMSVEAFTHMGVNPGYEGLMPAEDSAAGFAYVIAHAQEYHGQSADATQPLMQAGLLHSGKQTPVQAAPQKAKEEDAPITANKAYELSRELQNTLETVNKEFEALDIFKKTWSRNDFNKKAGISIKEWLKISSALTSDLKVLSNGAGKEDKDKILEKFSYLVPRLEKLAEYFRLTAEMAKGYFKDPESRAVALAALADRERSVQQVAVALKELNK
jgi:NAD(P)-dependent dehydrogenase (short-subunit alcohol dehydrogenase family)